MGSLEDTSEPQTPPAYLGLLTVCYRRERDHVSLGVHKTGVVLLPIQKVKVPVWEGPGSCEPVGKLSRRRNCRQPGAKSSVQPCDTRAASARILTCSGTLR